MEEEEKDGGGGGEAVPWSGRAGEEEMKREKALFCNIFTLYIFSSCPHPTLHTPHITNTHHSSPYLCETSNNVLLQLNYDNYDH